MEIELSYSYFKSIAVTKKILWQYIEDTSKYSIFSVDDSIFYKCYIYKDGYVPKGIDESQNTSDRNDFLNNYESESNKKLSLPLVSLIYGRKNISTAGTAEVLLNSQQTTDTMTITAFETNTGNIYIGNSSVDSDNGYILGPGASVSIDHDHAQDNIYIDSDNNDEGVSYIGSSR